ncbi:uroporphyrinogen-III C-methyltransferase [Phytomonospora sp. NPDC050363]|uniref:uroporphyrinogen-III C-methyltransferase n=1 Tax=Phytomonospora sp. NPDC050363 TaxID=3155642 RepID=UPI0033DDB4AC
MSLYPLGLRLAGRRVLVVGGGVLATRRVPALMAAGAHVDVVSPVVTPALQDLADKGRIGWHGRPFEPSDVDEAWLVLAATNEQAVNAQISARCEAQRVFCVRADDAEAATAWTPAVARHGEVTVAAFGGGDPRRAARLRDEIGERLADGSLTGKSFRDAPKQGRVTLVGAGPGDPELITVRGRRALAVADVVVVDRLAPHLLLDELRPEVEIFDAAKIPYGRYAAQEEINAFIVQRAKAGCDVVRLKGGDAFVFGRGGEEVAACVAEGIPVTVVPGVTSAIAAPSAAGIPVTHRGVVHDFTVVSGHVPPGHPKSLVEWPALARMKGTLVLLMAIENLPAITAALIDGGRDPHTPAAVIADATTSSQEVVHATLGTLGEHALRPPATVVIGQVTALAEELRGTVR